MRQSYSPSL